MTDATTTDADTGLARDEQRPYLHTAIRAARASASLQRAHQGETLEIDTKSNPADLVTHVDKLCEARIREIIGEAHPSHTILGEEEGMGGADAERDDARFRWIVDPIDGTTNYAHGIPYYCVSIALEVDGRLEVGVVIDSVRDEMFTAVRGGGTHLNGRPVHVSREADLSKAVLATGFPHRAEMRAAALEVFARALPTTRAVRRLGAAALDLANIACGRLDAFWEFGLNPWDVAAGTLLIHEAGGTVTGASGAPHRLDDPTVVASNGALHGKLVGTLDIGSALA